VNNANWENVFLAFLLFFKYILFLLRLTTCNLNTMLVFFLLFDFSLLVI